MNRFLFSVEREMAEEEHKRLLFLYKDGYCWCWDDPPYYQRGSGMYDDSASSRMLQAGIIPPAWSYVEESVKYRIVKRKTKKLNDPRNFGDGPVLLPESDPPEIGTPSITSVPLSVKIMFFIIHFILAVFGGWCGFLIANKFL